MILAWSTNAIYDRRDGTIYKRDALDKLQSLSSAISVVL